MRRISIKTLETIEDLDDRECRWNSSFPLPSLRFFVCGELFRVADKRCSRVRRTESLSKRERKMFSNGFRNRWIGFRSFFEIGEILLEVRERRSKGSVHGETVPWNRSEYSWSGPRWSIFPNARGKHESRGSFAVGNSSLDIKRLIIVSKASIGFRFVFRANGRRRRVLQRSSRRIFGYLRGSRIYVTQVGRQAGR